MPVFSENVFEKMPNQLTMARLVANAVRAVLYCLWGVMHIDHSR